MANQFYALIPAGKDFKIEGVYKHNLEFDGKSCLEIAISESLGSGLKVVSTVRESDNIRRSHSGNPDVAILESKVNLVDSCLHGIIEGIINNNTFEKFKGRSNHLKDIKAYIEKNPGLWNIRLVCIGSDSPFMSSNQIKSFMDRYDGSDIYVGMTDVDKVIAMDKALDLNLGNMGSTILNYNITDRGKLRIANMYIFNPWNLIMKDLAGPIQAIYNNKNLKHDPFAIFGLLWGLRTISPRLIRNYPESASTIKTLFLSREHIHERRQDEVIALTDTLKNASTVLGVTINVDNSCGIGPYLDIDDAQSYHKFKANYHLIRDHIQRNDV